MSKRWYVVHAYSGLEKSVQRALQERIDRSEFSDLFGQILVPSEEVVEIKGGQKSISERRFFPGYVLVEMEMTDETWHLVKNTSKVTGFIGGTGNRPTPISQKEVEKILSQMEEGVEKPRNRVRRSGLGQAGVAPEIGEQHRRVDRDLARLHHARMSAPVADWRVRHPALGLEPSPIHSP